MENEKEFVELWIFSFEYLWEVTDDLYIEYVFCIQKINHLHSQYNTSVKYNILKMRYLNVDPLSRLLLIFANFAINRFWSNTFTMKLYKNNIFSDVYVDDSKNSQWKVIDRHIQELMCEFAFSKEIRHPSTWINVQTYHVTIKPPGN